jgi:hypothetical protein
MNGGGTNMKKIVIEQIEHEDSISLAIRHEGVVYFELIGMLQCALGEMTKGEVHYDS